MGADRKAAPFALAGRVRLGKAGSGGGRHEVKASAGARSGAPGPRRSRAEDSRGPRAGPAGSVGLAFEGLVRPDGRWGDRAAGRAKGNSQKAHPSPFFD